MKTFLTIILASFLTFSGFGQVQPHAIGLRGGPGYFGYGGEVSYQHGIGAKNRLELDLGWAGNRHWHGKHGHYHGYRALGLSGIYQWVWNIQSGLNWYVGPGAQVGFFDHYDDDYRNDGVVFNVGGQIGIEYDFNIHGAPIQLSLDTRPMWGFFGYYNGLGFGGALGIRYTF